MEYFADKNIKKKNQKTTKKAKKIKHTHDKKTQNSKKKTSYARNT